MQKAAVPRLSPEFIAHLPPSPEDLMGCSYLREMTDKDYNERIRFEKAHGGQYDNVTPRAKEQA